MDYKDILVNNRRIVYFLGGVDSIYFDGTKGLIIPGRGVIMGGARDTHYHSCFGWLMPVLKKAGVELVPNDIEAAYKLLLEKIKDDPKVKKLDNEEI